MQQITIIQNLLIKVVLKLKDKVIQQNYISLNMSKDVSEVAFIPDNISNISSGRQAFNEDTSQKIQDYSVSKLTKNFNTNMDHYSGYEGLQNKNSNNKNFEDKVQLNQNQLNEQHDGRISFGKNQTPYKDEIEIEKARQTQIFQSGDKYAFPSYTLPIQHHGNQSHQQNNTDFQVKYTDTGVISQKQSLVEEKQENFANENQEKWKNDSSFYQRINLRRINTNMTYNQVIQTYPQTENQTFNIVGIDKYDEFQTQKGWLEHYVTANNKLLYRQTNTLLAYNQAVLNEIEKVQLRTKIIQLQIETNKLKIGLRKSPSTKHINFSVDFKMNRSPVLKIPKKVDQNLRNYCDQLQKKLIQARAQSQQNQTFLKLLQFYEEQFKKKVNFAYIYQQYLLEKGNNTLLKNYKFYKNEISRKSVSKNKYQRQSKTKNTLKSKKSFENNQVQLSVEQSIPSFLKNSDLQGDQSFTSLADKINGKNMKVLRRNDSNFSDYYNSPKKQRIPLTHHKKLDQPSKRNINDSQQNQQPALFNSANRSKKYFYYECQKYLKQLEKDYLIECEDEKRKILLNDQRGFRQRQLLKMKSQQMKNEILDTQVDVTTKQSELKKENQILLKQLQLLQNQFSLKYGDKYQHSYQTLPSKRQIKSPNISKGYPLNDYDLLYKQAQKRLKSYKSATFLENISKRNINQSPFKKTAQNSFNKSITSKQKISFKRIDSQQFQISPIKIREQNGTKTKRLKSQSKNKLVRSQSKQNKFLNRFKQKLPSNKIVQKTKNINQTVNPQKSQNKQIFGLQQQMRIQSQNKLVQTEYYVN